MNRLALAITSVLVLVPNLNYQTPILDTPMSNQVVSSFIKGEKPTNFPDRSVQAKSAKDNDIARQAEIERVRALEVQKQAQVQAQVKSVPNTPVLSSDDAFIQLSYCEAGGKPATNTGNGYYGMFQYDLQTWGNYMGYARPDLAPADVQLAKAKETQARRGWSPWPSCARKLGLM